MYAVILAGGVGTRLWPRSRESRPKQFTDITGDGLTMIQATAQRLEGLIEGKDLFVVTGEGYAGLAAEQLPQMPASHIVLEPSGRNTAPAIGLACLHLEQSDPQGVMAILPADHVILDGERFRAALRRANEVAEQGYLVTLGIEPTFAHTGYGYIKRNEAVIVDDDNLPVYSVERFLEKPKRALAEQFLNEGGYYWNGGIFVARVDVMLAELQRQAPDIYDRLAQIRTAMGTPDAQKVLAQVWEEMPSISVDYAVMEGAQKVAMVPMQAGWNDVGSWDALETILEQDAHGNSIAKGEVMLLDSRHNIVYSDKRLVALINVNNLVVVDTGDTLLIGDKNNMQRVKDVVEQLRSQGRTELL
ncbi:MAG: NTP transferase domain-containing protein [Caldilineaceae bacterium]|nr:NTP transferase domain-containing protein [Caldilineaceae bacterium]